MNIKKITIEGFKSIYRQTTIEFTETGLWKVSGPVGYGKTTIGECILFCLFGGVKDSNIASLISWGAKKCISYIELESRGHKIEIRRVVRTKGQGDLDIYIDGELLEYTNKNKAQQILEEDYFDVSKTTIESLCIISFKNFRSIVRMSPGSSETRKFIDDVFGFNIINKYIEKAKEKVAEASIKYNQINAELRTYTTQKEKYELSRARIDKEVNCSEIKSLEDKIEEKNNVLSNINMTWTSQSSFWSSQAESAMNRINVIKTEGKHIKETIEKLQNGICPLCGGKIEKESLDNYITKREDLLKEYNTEKKLYDDAVAKHKEAKNIFLTEQSAVTKEIQALNAEISRIKIQQKLLANNYDKLIDDLSVDIASKKEELTQATIEMNQWQELYDKLYKEGRSTLLKHYIPTLNKNINYYIQELHQPYILKFDETFKCDISAYGVDNIPASSLSTGQSKLVDTAVILGILKTMLNGVNFNISFLDELVSNMDEELRNVICVMLKKNLPDKLIFITTHAEIDDSYFDGKIKVKLHHWEEDDKLIQNSEYIISYLQ